MSNQEMAAWPEEIAKYNITIAVKVPTLGEDQNLKDMDTLAKRLFGEFTRLAKGFDPVGRMRIEIEKVTEEKTPNATE